MKYTTEQIFKALGIDKIVKTRDVFCSCGSTRVINLYDNIDLRNKKAYDNKKCEMVDIDKYTELDINYCVNCGRVDYIESERGYAVSYRMYYREDKIPTCPCGEGTIEDNTGYVVIMSVLPNGDMVVKSKHCNQDFFLNTSEMFENGDEFAEWLNKVAVVEVNKKEEEHIKKQADMFANMMQVAKNNNINVFTLDDLDF